jgi:hypothetical protein
MNWVHLFQPRNLCIHSLCIAQGDHGPKGECSGVSRHTGSSELFHLSGKRELCRCAGQLKKWLGETGARIQKKRSLLKAHVDHRREREER